MKHFLTTILSLFAIVSAAFAQTHDGDTLRTEAVASTATGRTSNTSFSRDNDIEDPLFPAPRYYAGNRYEVHEGVNVSVGLSATVGLGHGSPGGVGLGRSLDVLYVSPIRNKWNFAVGATSSAVNWGAFHHTDLGIYGSANYYPSDKVTLSVDAYKSLLAPKYSSLPYYMGDRYMLPRGLCTSPFNPCGDYYGPCYRGNLDSQFGAGLNLKLNRKTFIEFHVGTSTWRE